MDSKIKLVAVTCAILVTATIVGIVVLLNMGTGSPKRSSSSQQGGAQEQHTQEAPDEGQQDAFYEQYQLDPAKDPYAFLRQDDFFDPIEETEEVSGQALSLLVSSVQKDIRIHVVDDQGALVRGLPFEITLADGLGNPVEQESAEEEEAEEPQEGQPHEKQPEAGIYIDEDEDGIIYISQLPAGNYEVGLKPVEGYVVPRSDTPISVSNEISYTALDDISFLIKSEDEIDAKVEDTSVNEAERDADGTETNVRLADGASIFGIDVSKWNKEIDWQRVKDAGVEFAIIRCGYRGSKTGALVEDPYFERNIKGAQEAGVRVGIYFFTQAVTPVEAVEEASMVLALCREYKIAFPLYIDTEGAGGNGRADSLDTEGRTAVVRTFCETIENAGFTAGVYASKSWYENRLHTDELKKYQIWLAQYSRTPTYQGDYGMWQYTSAGTVDGISTLVDFNVSYMDY